jgi:Zn-dependent protease
MNPDVKPEFVVAQLIVIFVSIGLHEFAHCKFADMAGDPTPSYYGRVTLNLFKHFDPLGSLFIIMMVLWGGYGVGWGRPAPMDPSKMRNPRWDWFIAVIAGPLTNVLLAAFCGLILRICLRFGFFDHGGQVAEFVAQLLALGVMLNLGLAMFNMIPFGPLDGKWLLGLLLPERQRYEWFKFNQQVGIWGIFIIMFLLRSQNISIFSGPVMKGFEIITGLGVPN